MHNYFYIILASIITLQVYGNVMAATKIDGALSLINEETVAATITEKSKLEAHTYNDISYLVIDQNELDNVIQAILKENLSFTKYKVNYYYYDSVTLTNCPIGKNLCNSVQIQFIISYMHQTYKGELRYEPIQIL